MAVTIKKIADICGVSRGTVDRVLNGRGNVKKETEEKVIAIANELGYTGTSTKKLSAKRKKITVGVVLAAEGNSFFDDILKGMYQAQKELDEFGLVLNIKTMKGYDSAEQLALIEKIEDEISALVLNPISDLKIESKINALMEKGIPVATVNTDIETSKRLFYVGSNYTKGGEIACGMLALIAGKRANVGILLGSDKIMGHTKRVNGFKDTCQKKYMDFNVLAYAETDDDDIKAFEVTTNMLKEQPEINALYIAGAGVYGACRAVISSGRENDIHIICFDRVPGTVEMIERGLIKATICQQPFTQGNKCIHTMFNYLVSGRKPEKAQFIVKNEIRIVENI